MTGRGTFCNQPGRAEDADYIIVFSDVFYGGQGQNRTADTGIFRTVGQIPALIFQSLTGTPVAEFARQCTTVHD